MRIRITKSRTGVIDGVNLNVFHEGHNYEVDQSIASYLIVTGSAEPTFENTPSLVVCGAGREVLYSMVPATLPELATEDPAED
jgi:hypothetical protein